LTVYQEPTPQAAEVVDQTHLAEAMEDQIILAAQVEIVQIMVQQQEV
jgi:hypothetical protein